MFAPSSAFADAKPADADVHLDTSSADDSLEQVVVLAAKRPQPLREAPSSTSVITQADLDAYGWRDFTEAIQSLAGFYTTDPRDSTYLGVRGVSFKGDNNGRILILVDGHTQQELWSHSAYPELLGLDASMIDHIEVLRGPASTLYGSLGFLAIINVVTRRGGEHEWVRATYSMQNLNGFHGVLTLGHRHENGLEWGVQVNGTLSQGDSYSYQLPALSATSGETCADRMPRFGGACTGSILSNPAVDAATGIAAYGHLEWKGFSLKASYQYLDKKIPFAPFGTIFNDTTNHFLTTRAYVDMGYTAGRPETLELTARAYLDQASYVDDLKNPADANHPNSWIFHDEATPWWAGGELKLLLVREPSDKLRYGFTAGGEVTWLRGNDTSLDTTGASPPVQISHDLLFGSVYGQAEVSVAHKLQLTLGLRDDIASQFPSELSPRAALVLLPYSSGTFKLLYSHGFIHPSWYDTFFDDKISIAANPNLTPERADNYELVYQQQLGRPVTLTTSFFYIHGDKLIEQQTICVPDPMATAMDPCKDGTSARAQSQNTSSFQSLGAELGIVGRTTGGIRLYANYSFSHATGADGQPAFNSPAHVFKGGVSVPLWRDHLFAGVEGRFYSSRIYQLADPANGIPEASTDAFLDLGAHLTWKDLPRGLALTVKVHDATNQHYTIPSTTEDSHPFLQLPAGGLTVVTRLSYGF